MTAARTLTDADVDAIAERVVDDLADRIAKKLREPRSRPSPPKRLPSERDIAEAVRIARKMGLVTPGSRRR